jgi:hypothetical protein
MNIQQITIYSMHSKPAGLERERNYLVAVVGSRKQDEDSSILSGNTGSAPHPRPM